MNVTTLKPERQELSYSIFGKKAQTRWGSLSLELSGGKPLHQID